MDRLDYSLLNGEINLDPSYDPTGRITSMSDSSPSPRSSTSTTWYSYNLPNTITQTGDSGASSQFFYGPDRARWKQLSTSGSSSETWTYLGGLMEKRQVGATTEYRHYIYGGTGPAAIARRVSTGANATYYLTTDHLGSTDVITGSAGVVQLRASFDAFGNRRGANWSGPPSSSDYEQIANTTRRGFTFHEHLDNLSMIHMNGRVYDSASGQFTSADPFVQAPYFSQSLNRYSYTFNNPLSYTDPSGFSATAPDARPAGFDVDDVGDFLGDIYSGYFSWEKAYDGNGACAFDLSTEKAWRACIGLSWPMKAIEEAEPGAKTSNAADPPVSTVVGRGTWGDFFGGMLRGVVDDWQRMGALYGYSRMIEAGQWKTAGQLLASANTPLLGPIDTPRGQFGYDLAPASQIVVGGGLRGLARRGTTMLFRAVGPAELADIQATGALRSIAGLEGKYFTTSAEAASSYAKQAVKGFGDPPYTLIGVRVPNSIFDGLTPATVDRGIPAWVIPNERLRGLTPEVLNVMPIPGL